MLKISLTSLLKNLPVWINITKTNKIDGIDGGKINLSKSNLNILAKK